MSFFASIKNFFQKHVFRHISAKLVLWIVTGLCVVSLLYQYFARPDSLSPLSIVGAVVIPFQEGANKVGGALFKNEQERLTLNEAREEVARLEKEKEALEIEVRELKSLAVDNEELRALLKARERYGDYEMIEATVIGNDGINCFERFTINRGTRDGIRVNMNVINQDGLVGIVSKVGLNYAVVTSIIEDGINVSAMTKNGHENCIVSGDLSQSGKDTLLFSNMLSDVDLNSDSSLVTSNISDRFLPELLIGYVSESEMNAGGLTQSGTLKTAVDFTRIREVLVITTTVEQPKEEEK